MIFAFSTSGSSFVFHGNNAGSFIMIVPSFGSEENSTGEGANGGAPVKLSMVDLTTV